MTSTPHIKEDLESLPNDVQEIISILKQNTVKSTDSPKSSKIDKILLPLLENIKFFKDQKLRNDDLIYV